jgi:type II secretory ATPase GspE/PulE/Tfp pilus assembly ATPase PilB-like protein
MVVEMTQMAPLPPSLIDRVALDRNARILYADKAIAGNPMLLTWLDRNKSAGLQFSIKPIDVDEVAKLRAGGMRQLAGDDDDKQVRAAAMEIIVQAAAYGASDVHLMMRGTHTEIQIVVKGGLRVLDRKTHEEGEALARAIYQGIAKTRDASYNTLEFQNAQIPGDELSPETGLTSVRIVRGPCYPQSDNGAFMTMRLQYNSVKGRKSDLPALELPRRPDGEFRLLSMGYTPNQIEKLRTLMDSPNGVIIFTGPTGSGKTTSMFEALQEIARTKPQRRLVTIEDPVEYPMDWAVQMAVTGARNDAETGAAFGERLRVALRMAPHILLLGELRGPDVAAAALEAAVTGHQVWTTMHVTDPFLFVERLELMDRERLERRVFCDHKTVRGVIGNRLIPKLCPHCSLPLSDNPDALQARMTKALGTWGELSKIRVQGAGCAQCGHDGTLGRFAVAEVVITDAELMRDFIGHGSETARDNHRAKPGADPSMLEAAIAFALQGEVDPRHIEDSVDLIEPRDRRRK